MNQQSSEQLTYQNQITNNYHNTLQGQILYQQNYLFIFSIFLVDTNVHYPTQVQPTYYEPPPQQPQQPPQQPHAPVSSSKAAVSAANVAPSSRELAIHILRWASPASATWWLACHAT